MKWSKLDLARLYEGHLEFVEEFSFDRSTFMKNSRIRELRNIVVKGNGFYDANVQRLYLDLDITGEMIVPCDITFEDVLLPIDTQASLTFAFYKDDDPDVIEAKGDVVDLLPEVFQLIYMEIPLKVVKKGKITYPSGDGWEVIKEEDYQKSKSENLDPRLAKLREYQPKE